VRTRFFITCALVGAIAACHQNAATPPGPVQTNTLIVNAEIFDGSGAPGVHGDVRIVGDRIVGVGALDRMPQDDVIDAKGAAIAPGFIDDHSHHDGGLLNDRTAAGAVSQGITTIVVGQDGGSHYPLATYFDTLTRSPAAVNVASYTGHGTLRRLVMGDDYKRPARPDEIARMQELLKKDMDAGSLGLSSGLEYDPGIYSTTGELVELAKTASASEGRYISHLRSEEDGVWDAIAEILTIGREAHLPVQVSHMKLSMKSLWGKTPRLLHMLDSARAAGIKVTADVYPYNAWSSDLTVNFPKRNYDDTAAARHMLDEIVPPDGLLMAAFAPHPDYVGQTLLQISTARGTSPERTLLDLIHEAGAYADAHHLRIDDGEVQSVIGRSMLDGDVDRIMQWPLTAFCTDGSLGGRHPRGTGSFPRILGRFVRERGVLSLADAIHKMTLLAADNVGIPERGRIAPGQIADLVLFDQATVIDHATYTDPHALSTGIERVWVSGQLVWADGHVTGATPGRVVARGKAWIIQVRPGR